MARRSPQPPSGLRPRGRALWRSIHGALGGALEFDERELAILALACRQADDVAALEAALDAQGAVVAGSTGQPRVSPVFAEVRQARLATARLLGELGLPDAEDQARSASSRRAQHAATVRWAQDAARRELARGA